MKKRILAAVLAVIMTIAAAPEILPAASITVSAASSKKLAAPEDLKASKKTDTSITLKWSAVEGADKYAVYRYDSKTEKYVKVKNVTKTSCTVTGLSAGKKYSFKVAALVKGKDGKYAVQTKSEAKSVKTAKYPTFTAPKFGAKKDDLLESANYVMIPSDSGETYNSNVIYNGKEAFYMLMFNEDETVKGYFLAYEDVSRKEYNARVAALEDQYGAPESEYGDSTGSSKLWVYTDPKKKESIGVIVTYDATEQSIMEAYAYGYNTSGVAA